MLETVITGKRMLPPRLFVCGPQGVGKNTFADSCPSPIIVQAEEGADTIGTPRLPLCTTYEQMMQQLQALGQEPHAYLTVVIDTADWVEKLIHEKVCREKNVKTVEGIGYGKWRTFAMEYWDEFKTALKWLRDTRGLIVVILSHCQIKRFDSPETESYDKYYPKLDDRAGHMLTEWVDAALFLNFRHYIVKEDMGFNKSAKRAVGTGERLIYTSERPSHMAKNRYGLPPELPFPRTGAWTIIQNAILASAAADASTTSPTKAA